MATEVLELANVILSSAQTIHTLYSQNSEPFPSLNAPSPAPFIDDPKYEMAATVAIAACARLIASLRNPYAAVHQLSGSAFTCSWLNVAVEAGISETLREAGDKGMHIRHLSQKVGVDEAKLGQGMRYLCAINHVYREISPDVFTNNRLSSALDTGKSSEEIRQGRLDRYDNIKPSAAPVVGHTTDAGLMGAAVLSSVVLSPSTASSVSPLETPVVIGIGFKTGNFWEWMEKEGNEKRLRRFGAAMSNMGKLFPADTVASAYDWEILPKGSKVVDVGGGVGGTTMTLAKKFPYLRFLIQDRAAVVPDGEKFWNANYPEALQSGLAMLQAHDFFTPQPVIDASVFILRMVLHDWPTAYASRILSHLRKAAQPHTKLVLLEHIVPYTCRDTTSKEKYGFSGDELPDVLEGNVGVARGTIYMLNVQMLNTFNAQERTIGEWESLLHATGWKIESIRPGALSSIVATVVEGFDLGQLQ